MTHPLSSWDVFTSLSVSELISVIPSNIREDPPNKVCLSRLSPPVFRPINGSQVTCFKLSWSAAHISIGGAPSLVGVAFIN